MNEVAQTLVDGLIEREQDVGSTITWAGGEYPCSGGGEAQTRLLRAFGIETGSAVDIVVRNALFPDGGGLPSAKQTLLYKSVPEDSGRTLRISKATPIQKALIVLECEDPNRGS